MKAVFYPTTYGLTLSANLFTPENFDENKQYSAIVVGHPFGGVKEQTAGIYAKKLADKGFVTLAFDASFQGESTGEPRGLESPAHRVDDVISSVDFLMTLPFVDSNKIGVLGICASGGYTNKASQTDKRIKAWAGVSPADVGITFRKGWTGDQTISSIYPLLEQISAQRTAEANGAETLLVPIVDDELNPEASEEWQEAHFYYRTPRAEHPRSTNRTPFISFGLMMSYSSFDLVGDLLTQPALYIIGGKALTAWQSKDAFERTASQEKELFVVEGASHFDMYDIEPYTSQATNKLATFFNQYL